SPMTSMPSFTMSGASQQNQHTTSSMSSLSTGGGMSPMGMTVGMTVGPSPGACLQQRDNGYSCGVARPPSYEPLHLGYGARPTCSPTQPYHAASLNQYNQNASSTGLISPGVSVPIAVPGQPAPDMAAQYWSPRLQRVHYFGKFRGSVTANSLALTNEDHPKHKDLSLFCHLR
ncbi:hypothetical protein ALC56_05242, partial [Trachymyrmex septentrionalis]